MSRRNSAWFADSSVTSAATVCAMSSASAFYSDWRARRLRGSGGAGLHRPRAVRCRSTATHSASSRAPIPVSSSRTVLPSSRARENRNRRLGRRVSFPQVPRRRRRRSVETPRHGKQPVRGPSAEGAGELLGLAVDEQPLAVGVAERAHEQRRPHDAALGAGLVRLGARQLHLVLVALADVHFTEVHDAAERRNMDGLRR